MINCTRKVFLYKVDTTTDTTDDDIDDDTDDGTPTDDMDDEN